LSTIKNPAGPGFSEAALLLFRLFAIDFDFLQEFIRLPG
jgi:hypothetical protein